MRKFWTFGTTPCIGLGCPDSGDLAAQVDAIQTPVGASSFGGGTFGRWTVSVAYTASCPISEFGNQVSTVGTYTSNRSYWDAFWGATLDAINQANQQLVCSVTPTAPYQYASTRYTATISFTATCPSGSIGNPAPASFTATSIISQADANTQAVAGVTAAAMAALVCSAPSGSGAGCSGYGCTGGSPFSPSGGGGSPGFPNQNPQQPQGPADGSGPDPVPTPIQPDPLPSTHNPTPGCQPAQVLKVEVVSFASGVAVLKATIASTDVAANIGTQWSRNANCQSNTGIGEGGAGTDSVVVIPTNAPTYSGQTTTGVYATATGYVWVGSDPFTGSLVVLPVQSADVVGNGTNLQAGVVISNPGFGTITFPDTAQLWLQSKAAIVTVTAPSGTVPGTFTQQITVQGANAGDCYSVGAGNSCGSGNTGTVQIPIPGSTIAIAFVSPTDGSNLTGTSDTVTVTITPAAGVALTNQSITVKGVLYYLTTVSGNTYSAVVDTSSLQLNEHVVITCHASGFRQATNSDVESAASITVIQTSAAPTTVLTLPTQFYTGLVMTNSYTGFPTAAPVTAVRFYSCDSSGANQVWLNTLGQDSLISGDNHTGVFQYTATIAAGSGTQFYITSVISGGHEYFSARVSSLQVIPGAITMSVPANFTTSIALSAVPVPTTGYSIFTVTWYQCTSGGTIIGSSLAITGLPPYTATGTIAAGSGIKYFKAFLVDTSGNTIPASPVVSSLQYVLPAGGVYPSGVDASSNPLASNSSDPHWNVAGVPATVQVDPFVTPYGAGASSSTSRWISTSTHSTGVPAPGFVDFTTTITLTSTKTVTITTATNSGQDALAVINGINTTVSSSTSYYYCLQNLIPHNLGTLPAGTYTLTLRVYNSPGGLSAPAINISAFSIT